MKVLRAVLSIASLSLASAIGAGTAVGQTTTLTINGATAADNSATVNVAAGTTMTITVSNSSNANRPYGVFAALANNASSTGWYLDVSGPKNPFPVLTGVPTLFVENDYGVDIVPDRGGSPGIKLNSSGTATLSLSIPNGMTGTIYFQAVTLPSGGSTTNFSNAVAVTFAAATSAGRLLATQSAVDVDHVQFGVLTWTGGDPRAATFNQPDVTLANIKPDIISLGDINDWVSHFGSTGGDKGRDVDWHSPIFGPGINNDNHEYIRLSLPGLPGADGLPGTADDIPPRDLMRCYDNVTLEGFFLVINKGANPFAPGVDFYPIPGTRFKDSVLTSLNSWKIGIQLSPDGSRAAAIYDDSSTAAGFEPKMFLFATDCSKPYLVASLPSDIIDVTPSGTTAFNTLNNLRTTLFTNNRLWFANGTAALNNMKLWTVDIRVQQPSVAQVTVLGNQNYFPGTPPPPISIDTIPEKGMIVPREGGTTMCFLMGDTFSAVGAPENIQKGDWYAVTEAKPTQAVNLSKFRLYGSAGTTVPKMLVPGDVWNGQTGFATMSPDSTKLAFVSVNSNENGSSAGEDDEIYIVSTLDSDGNNEGDDAGTAFDNPITTNARIDSRSISNTLDNSHDLYMPDAATLYFFYGIETTSTDRLMDLFHWNNSTLTLTDVTSPAKVAPITTAGTISPEGIFLSPNLRYFYFSRGITAGTKANLVGVDTTTRKAFNVTGSEFSGTTTTDVNNTGVAGENFNWHLSFAGGSFPSLCYFAAPVVTGGVTNLATNIWVFDANFPTAAIQLTTDNPGVAENVDSLTGNPFGLGCTWMWERATSASADYEYQDLLFFFRDVLSDTAVPFTSQLTLAGFEWIRAATSNDPTGAAPAGLICAIGDNAAVGSTDQASDAEFYYFSLNGTTNYDFDSIVGVNAPGHQVGTTALSGLPFSGIIQIYFADVE